MCRLSSKYQKFIRSIQPSAFWPNCHYHACQIAVSMIYLTSKHQPLLFFFLLFSFYCFLNGSCWAVSQCLDDTTILKKVSMRSVSAQTAAISFKWRQKSLCQCNKWTYFSCNVASVLEVRTPRTNCMKGVSLSCRNISAELEFCCRPCWHRQQTLLDRFPPWFIYMLWYN